MEDWHAHWPLDLEQATCQIRRRFPVFATAPIRRLGEGWDNLAVIAGDAAIFRFPKRPLAVQRLELERALLPLLAELLPQAVPQPTWFADADAHYAHPFMGYPLLPGRTACALQLSERARCELARPLGAFLRALHGIQLNHSKFAALPIDTRNRLNPEVRLPLAHANAKRAHALGLLPDEAAFLTCLEESSQEGFPSSGQNRLLHGDLYARHLLILPEGHLGGVIDWGDMHRGDVAEDLEILHSFLPPQAQETFLAAYGTLDLPTWHRARFRALYHNLMMLIYAAETGDGDLLAEMRVALALVLRQTFRS